MQILKQKKFLLTLLMAVMILVPQIGLARGLVPCGGYTDSGGYERACTFVDIFSLIATVINYLIGVAGIYAVFQIVSAGFWLAVSGGNEENITKNKDGLTYAVLGFILVMMAFLLVNTVDNYILGSKCKLDLASPLNYMTSCQSNPNAPTVPAK